MKCWNQQYLEQLQSDRLHLKSGLPELEIMYTGLNILCLNT